MLRQADNAEAKAEEEDVQARGSCPSASPEASGEPELWSVGLQLLLTETRLMPGRPRILARANTAPGSEAEPTIKEPP